MLIASARGGRVTKSARQRVIALIGARDEIGREETLAEKLRAHVEQCDAANALEHVASGGSSLPRQATARPPPRPATWH